MGAVLKMLFGSDEETKRQPAPAPEAKTEVGLLAKLEEADRAVDRMKSSARRLTNAPASNLDEALKQLTGE